MVSNIFYCPKLWDVILPINELHFSRWLKHVKTTKQSSIWYICWYHGEAIPPSVAGPAIARRPWTWSPRLCDSAAAWTLCACSGRDLVKMRRERGVVGWIMVKYSFKMVKQYLYIIYIATKVSALQGSTVTLVAADLSEIGATSRGCLAGLGPPLHFTCALVELCSPLPPSLSDFDLALLGHRVLH